jgi:outer membrane murein-binding lipoprotein Lpp
MESKGYFIAILCLVGGVIGGYLAGSMSFQNQSKSYDLQLQTKEAQIQQLQLQVQTLQANITSLQNIIKGLQTPKLTQVRIDSVTWLRTLGVLNANFDLLIRNTGSVAAQIESISIRTNTAGSTASVWTAPAGSSIDVGATSTLHFTWATSAPVFGLLVLSTSYIIRVTTSTGFYYEMVATTPSS